ncbi:Ubiquitin-like/40S ribosomal S30 protein fusion [Trachipleistophora hominis]|uniref:40S ribosomal protein S30 n=1 Tax=Trachipleistophora hominis TaxID=72359 RepID=L7JYU7_TRAHO|nr:Ubiquitin-like/40S ribosomal S30 protein fusion [Trachipleistophora hominis]
MAKNIPLNRAGKVRNQTAKVPKKEKERAKTGRARRREMYSRRVEQGLFKNGTMRFNPQF